MASFSTVIRTNSGAMIDILHPDPALICIEDIAHSLSHICRYNGHVDRHYSVAQHSVIMAIMPEIPGELKLTALLHDAAEAYLGDVVKPLKHLLPEYLKIEENMERVIAKAFGLVYPFPKEIHGADWLMLQNELDLCFDGHGGLSWTPEQSKKIFLDTYVNLVNQR